MACTESEFVAPPEIRSSLLTNTNSVEITTPELFFLEPNDYKEVRATIRDAAGGEVDGRITWSSGNPTVVRAPTRCGGRRGLEYPCARSLREGLAEIVASHTESAVTVSDTILAQVRFARRMRLTGSRQTWYFFRSPGARFRMQVEVLDRRNRPIAGAPVTFESSAPFVAEVDTAGTVTVVGYGGALITARAGRTRTSIIVDVLPPVNGVRIEPDALIVGTGAEAELQLLGTTVTDGEEIPVSGYWVSLADSIAVVRGGGPFETAATVTGVSAGTTSVIATHYDGETDENVFADTARVTVVNLDAVRIHPTEISLRPGDTLRAELRAYNEGRELDLRPQPVWRSLDGDVVTITQGGLITARGVGHTSITAHSGQYADTVPVRVRRAGDGPVPGSPPTDRAVLVALWEATTGPGWIEREGWLSERPIGEWHGVTTGPDGRVTALRLGANNLAGSIPPELGHLTRLETLDFERNALAGPIPPELGRLASLRSLNLGVNRLTRIPPELGDLADLEILRLRRNFLAGPVPPELGNLRNLRRVGLERNRLTGSIPLAFLQLDRLLSLHFEINAGLCVSGSTDFHAWLAKLEIYVGPLCNERDRAVLPSLYEAAGGTGWTRSDGWLGDGALDDWYGVAADALGRVVGIDLSSNGMTGRVSSSLAGLSGLTSLKIGGNPDLGGSLPRSLSALSLRELHYEGTGLCVPPAGSSGGWPGSIPSHEGTDTECAALTDRDILALFYEATGGTGWTDDEHWLSDRPLTEWEGVTTDNDGDVIYLYLHDHNLTGVVPPELGGLSSLQDLRLGSNHLTGPVPSELGDLSDLQLLDLGLNDLTGPIPPELGKLSRLTGLYLRSNDLTGRIPPELGDLTALTELALGSNDLTGPIPPELGDLTALTSLSLSSNDLTGRVPPELGDLTALTELNLNSNDLTEIPPELGDLAALTSLNLGSNDLTEIPPELGGLTSLTDLSIDRNRLTGPIPPELGDLAALTWLSLRSNDLTGPIPPELGGLTSLADLYLDGNRLTRIPPELGGMSSLGTLWLQGNSLTGPIPSELGRLTSLRSLRLYDNRLTGPIPPELGSLSALRSLTLMRNQLTGAIPAELSDLTSLVWLHLSGNPGMSGPLPGSLATLDGLWELLLDDTDLCTPDDADIQEWLSQLRLARVRRCGTTPGSGAYLTQAVQSLAYPVPLVAGDEALLRVFVTASRSTSEGLPPMRATFYVDGTETHAVDIPGSETPIPTDVDDAEGALETSANVEIPGSVIQPGLEFVVEVDPANELDPGLGVARRIPETGRAQVRVEAVRTLDLTFVPFVWAAGSDRSIVDIARAMAADPYGHELLQDTRTLIPVRELEVTAHQPILTSTTNVFTLHRETAAARTLEGGTGWWMGIMPEDVIGGRSGLATVGGSTSFSSATSYVIGHEVGHNLSLRHAPCGGAGGPDAAFPQANGTIGDWGYDFRDGGSLVPPHAPDLMGYCGPPRWMSGYGFTKATNYRLRTEVDTEDDTGAGAFARARAAEAPTRTLLLWGGVDALGEPFLEPAFVVDAPPAVPSSPGEYELTGRAETGGELFSLSFDMPEMADGDGSSSFVFALPAQAEWAGQLASITLSGPAGSTTMDRTTDQPMAIVRDPDSGRVLGILRDPSSDDIARAAASAGLAAAAAAGPDLEVLVSRGIPAETGR